MPNSGNGRRSRGSTDRTTSSTAKGRMIEEIVARMHARPGIQVECNVKLAPASGTGSQKREFDVLISTEVLGYPVRWAIECKNEKEPVGSPYVDTFISKLQYVGIPSQNGIFVSTSRYTKGALERAKAAGMRPLMLRDALRDLDTTIACALQTVVFLLPIVNGLVYENSYTAPMDTADDVHVLYNEQGEPAAILADLAWQAWMRDLIPSALGQHEVDVASEQPVYQRIDNQLVRVTKITIRMLVLGLLMQFTGETSQYHLQNAENNAFEKGQITAKFDLPAPGKRQLVTLDSEDQLREYVNMPAVVKVTNRLRLPRVNYWNALYWPPSDRVVRIAAERMRAFEEGLIPDPRPFNIVELEGTELERIFENVVMPSFPRDERSGMEGSVNEMTRNEPTMPATG